MTETPTNTDDDMEVINLFMQAPATNTRLVEAPERALLEKVSAYFHRVPEALDLTWAAEGGRLMNEIDNLLAAAPTPPGEGKRQHRPDGYDAFKPLWADNAEAKITALQSDLHAAREREAGLREALERVKAALLIPAAEYVPAIPDAWEIIDRALSDHPVTEEG